MMEDDKHLKTLAKYCRLCKQKITTDGKYPYPKPCIDFQEAIIAVYAITCVGEDERIYPKLMCKNCCRNVKRDVKNGKTRVASQFIQHNSSCEICLTESQQVTKTKTPIQLHKHSLDKLFSTNGFITFSKSPRMFCKLTVYESNVHAELTIIIHDNGSWDLNVNGKSIDLSKFDLPPVIDDGNSKHFLDKLLSYQICTGNKKYIDVIQGRIVADQPFLKTTGELAAIVESRANHAVFSKETFDIVRHPDCPVLFLGHNSDTCEFCLSLNKNFKIFQKRIEEKNFDIHTKHDSPTNLRHLSKEELIV